MHRRVVVIAGIFLGSLLILAGAQPALGRTFILNGAALVPADWDNGWNYIAYGNYVSAVANAKCGDLYFAGYKLARGAANYQFSTDCTWAGQRWITIKMRGYWSQSLRLATEQVEIVEGTSTSGTSTRIRSCSEDPWLAPDEGGPAAVCTNAPTPDSMTGGFQNWLQYEPFPMSWGCMSEEFKHPIRAQWLVLNPLALAPQPVLSRGVPPTPPTVQAVEPRIFYKHPREGTGTLRATTAGAAAGHTDVRINFSGSIPTAAAYRVDGEGWWVGVGPPEVVRDTALVKIPTTVFQESQHTVEVRLSNAVGGSAGTVLIEEHPPQGTRGSVDLHVNPSMQGDLLGAPAGRRDPQGTIQKAPVIQEPIRGAIRPNP